MRLIIVDDEPFARSRIAHLIQQVDGMEIVAQCSNGASAIHAINEHQPDLVFLDINIRDMDGFQVLEQIHARPYVVFVTAHEDFAVKAFDYEAFDYLVKPFSEERFFRTVNKLIKLESTEHLKKIAVKQGSRTVMVPTEEIQYILASGVYAEIFTEKGKYVHRESLSNLEQELNPQHFFRVHRSAIVNLGAVKELVHAENAGIEVRMPDGALVGVSKTQRKAFLHKIKA
jgi:two-component system LytT family response regulator